ncbi:hypothetical protein CU098_000172, partial [Rhizopus stolonifer]
DLLVTAYCYENDADVEALKNSVYLADNQVLTQGETKNHFLKHDQGQQQENQVLTIMAFQHKTLPLWGVQFHPESVSTEYGSNMILNFQTQTYAWMIQENQSTSKLELYIKPSCPSWIDPQVLADELISENARGSQEKYMGWLDSSRKSSPYSRMSILSFNPAAILTYSTLHKELRTTQRNSTITTTTALETNFFDYLSDLLDMTQVVPKHILGGSFSPCEIIDDLDFQGGLVGYLGYEMKRESMEGYKIPKEQVCHCQHHGQDHCCLCIEEPDAAFQFVDQFLVFDQMHRQIYLCCLVGHHPWFSREPSDAIHWIQSQEQKMLQIAELGRKRKLMDDAMRWESMSSPRTTPTPSVQLPMASHLFTPDVEHQAYLKSIESCIDHIKEGESYEICLTTRFRLELPKHISTRTTDPVLWRLYTHYLRKNNPAPFSALLMFPQLGLLSSSPERFLSVSRDQVAEMKPIKGTVARVLDCVCPENQCDLGEACKSRQWQQDEERKQQLWQDVKERAENLMIVDLIRNDLAQVCDPNSVRVPKLMHVETYEKVHHLVSTIRGQLRSHVNSVEALRTCFPPGSMTGAPKLRSVQILDRLETHRPRGVYSGCLGYFSLNGSADFNVVIRTAVVSTRSDNSTHVSVGGGGAITFLSNPEQEWKETLLKTKSVAPSVKEFLEDQL